MNIASDGAFRISIGRSFQSVEDEYLKCLSPNLVLVSVREGTAKTMVLAVLKAVGGYGINTQFNGSSVEGSHGIIYGSNFFSAQEG